MVDARTPMRHGRLTTVAARRATRFLVIVAVTAAVSTLHVAEANAAPARDCTLTWVGPASGSFSVAANWSPARKPTSTTKVCLPTGARSQVRLTSSAQVRSVSTGDGVLVLSAGVTLQTRYLTLDGTGGIRGSGTVSVSRGVVVPAGGVPVLADGVHVVSQQSAVISGDVSLTGGSVLTARSVGVVDADVSDDGNPGNLIDTGGLISQGDVTLSAPFRARTIEVDVGRLSLPKLPGADPGGVTSFGVDQVLIDQAELVVPYPITTLVGTTVELRRGATVTAASNRRPAFARLKRVIGGLTAYAPVSSSVPLTVGGGLAGSASRGGSLLVGSTVAAPSLTLDPGGSLIVDDGGQLELGDSGSGAVTVCSGDAAPCRVQLGDGFIGGSLVQSNGAVAWSGLRRHATQLTGDWSSGPNARLDLQADSGSQAPLGATNVVVGGHATLSGRLAVSAYSHPAVGTVETLLTATGGLTASFTTISPAAGWQIGFTSSTITATYLGT